MKKLFIETVELIKNNQDAVADLIGCVLLAIAIVLLLV